MLDKICELYYTCCPGVITYDERIKSVINRSKLFTRELDGKLVGAAAVTENKIAFVCVHPDYRRRGIGTALFAECEEYVKSQGYDSVQMYGIKDYITPGAPIYEGNIDFFTKLGYIHTWGEDECVDMAASLENYSHSEYKLGDTVDGITYRLATPADRENVLECVTDALEDFREYYTNPELYNGDFPEMIVAAFDGDLAVGALLVECYSKDSGSVGCTSTRHSHRGRGVATTMVKVGTRHLADNGVKSAWLGFTYTGIIPMYGKSGYKVSMKYFMGRKSL